MTFSTGAKPYVVVNQPSPIVWPITVDELKLWAKIFNSAQDGLLQTIINGVTLQAERYTKKSFITKEYETKRDVFGDLDESPNPGFTNLNNCPVVLRRSPFVKVESITYISDGSPVVMPEADYQVATKEAYSQVYTTDSSSWPTIDTDVVQPITINFKAGFGETADDVPDDIKDAILAHATAVYKNSGDCSSGAASCSCRFAPPEAMAVYNSYRILEFRAF